MAITINPIGGGSSGGLVPTIRATAPIGSTVTCDGQSKVVGSEGYVDFEVSAEPRNILPSGVQGLEYIESTGTQWIDLGIKPTIDTGVEIDFQVTQLTTNMGVFGCGISGNASTTYWFFRHSGAFQFNVASKEFTATADTNRHTLLFNDNKRLVYDGQTLGTFTATSLALSERAPIIPL